MQYTNSNTNVLSNIYHLERTKFCRLRANLWISATNSFHRRCHRPRTFPTLRTEPQEAAGPAILRDVGGRVRADPRRAANLWLLGGGIQSTCSTPHSRDPKRSRGCHSAATKVLWRASVFTYIFTTCWLITVVSLPFLLRPIVSLLMFHDRFFYNLLYHCLCFTTVLLRPLCLTAYVSLPFFYDLYVSMLMLHNRSFTTYMSHCLCFTTVLLRPLCITANVSRPFLLRPICITAYVSRPFLLRPIYITV